MAQMTPTVDGAHPRAEHRIPPPDGAREPLKVNVYERMQHANTQLVPLFPYYGPGAIVYSGALFRGGPGYDVGHFFHNNTVTRSRSCGVRTVRCSRPGASWRTPNLHGVNSFLRDPESPDSFLLITICSARATPSRRPRSSSGGARSATSTCSCTSSPIARPRSHDDRFPEFPTHEPSVEPVARFNSDESLRTCHEVRSREPAVPDGASGAGRSGRMQQRTVNDARAADAREGSRGRPQQRDADAMELDPQEDGAGVRRGEGVRALRRDASARRRPRPAGARLAQRPPAALLPHLLGRHAARAGVGHRDARPRASPVRYHRLEPGDLVYLPAGTAESHPPRRAVDPHPLQGAARRARSRGLVLHLRVARRCTATSSTPRRSCRRTPTGERATPSTPTSTSDAAGRAAPCTTSSTSTGFGGPRSQMQSATPDQ